MLLIRCNCRNRWIKNWRCCRWKKSWPNLRNCPTSWLNSLRKTTERLHQDYQSVIQKLQLGLPKHKAAVIHTCETFMFVVASLPAPIYIWHLLVVTSLFISICYILTSYLNTCLVMRGECTFFHQDIETDNAPNGPVCCSQSDFGNRIMNWGLWHSSLSYLKLWSFCLWGILKDKVCSQ